MSTVVAVIGSSGFIGSEVVRQLRRDASMKVVPYDLQRPSNSDEEWNPLDILSYASVERALAGKDAVLHFAGPVLDLTKKSPGTAVELEMTGTANILDAAVAAGLSKVLLSSSFYVYDYLPAESEVDEVTPIPMQFSDLFSAGKLMVEAMARHWGKIHGMNCTVFRFGSAYGAGKRCSNVIRPMLVSAMDSKPWEIWGAGNRRNQYTYVKDIANGVIAALKSDVTGIYNLISPEVIRVKDVAEMMKEMFGLQYELFPDKPEPRSSPTMMSYKACADFGWSPTPIRIGLQEVWDELSLIKCGEEWNRPKKEE